MKKFHHPHDPMWVVGCIDHAGGITGRVVKSGGSVTHGPEESRGRRWRWNIWGNEFHATRNPAQDKLSREEYRLVMDWLIRRGHAEEDSP